MNILVVAAHPDDELLGVGGTVASHILKGDRVKVAVMCEGISARYSPEGLYELRSGGRDDPAELDLANIGVATLGTRRGYGEGGAATSGITSRQYVPERLDQVKKETYRAARILGVTDLVFGELPDQRLETLTLSDLAKKVERLVCDFEPELVYTHFGGDINRDHRVLAEAVLVAVRPYAAPMVKEILMFETPSSTEWSSPSLTASFQPTVFVDISECLAMKIEAFRCYSAEVRPYPHPRSPEALADRAHYWGSLVNRRAAEAFVVVRSTR
jgi:LmbE family N-acetylglucosaminyl deacetylase